MRIGIVGTGALGSLFAAYLTAVAEVVMLGSWRAQLEAVAHGGLLLSQPDGGIRTLRCRVAELPTAVRTLAPFDLALVLVKSYQTESAAQRFAPFLTAGGLAVTLQNGLGNREALAAVLGAARTGVGTTAQGATLLGPGHVLHAGRGPTYLGDSGHVLIAPLAELLNAAGLETQLTTAVDSLMWGKLAVNAGINPLTALLGVPNGYLAEHPQAKAVMQAAAEEVAAVAQAHGIALPYPSAGARVLDVARATARNHSSMLQDVERGAPTEIDAICGAVVAHARAAGVAVPLNAQLLDWVHGREQRRPLPDPDSLLQTLAALAGLPR